MKNLDVPISIRNLKTLTFYKESEEISTRICPDSKENSQMLIRSKAKVQIKISNSVILK